MGILRMFIDIITSESTFLDFLNIICYKKQEIL